MRKSLLALLVAAAITCCSSSATAPAGTASPKASPSPSPSPSASPSPSPSPKASPSPSPSASPRPGQVVLDNMVLTVSDAQLLSVTVSDAMLIEVELEIDNEGSIPLSVAPTDFSLINGRGEALGIPGETCGSGTLSLSAAENHVVVCVWEIESSWLNGAGEMILVYGPTAWTANQVRVDLTDRLLGTQQ